MMLAHYLALVLPPSASQDEIRRRYLELIRAYPPSREPEYSQRIIAAYDALKDERTRVETAIFGLTRYGDFELALEALVRARAHSHSRSTPGLKTLLAAEGKLDE